MFPTAEAATTETRIAVGESLAQPTPLASGDIDLAPSATGVQTREEIRLRIEEIGIIPTNRTSSAEDALFAATAIARAGIPIVEVNANFPGAMGVRSHLAKHAPDVTVGAGSVLNANTARRCWAEGAKFLSCDGLLPDVVDFAAKQNVLMISGGLTPTEVIAAWNSGSDFVKVFPVRRRARPPIHPFLEGCLAGRTPDRRRRRDSSDRLGFPPPQAPPRWASTSRLFPTRRIPVAPIGVHSGIGPPLPDPL